MAMNIRAVTPGDVAPILASCHRKRYSAFIMGEPGIGKSEIINTYAQETCDGNIVDLRLTVLQPSSIRGMEIPDLKKGVTRHLLPEWWPTDQKSKGVLFFDEFDRADQYMQAAAMSILLERHIGGHKLPEGWLVVAAGNGIEFSDHTTDLDPAVADRLIKIRVAATLESTLSWGIKTGRMADRTLSFLRANPDALSKGAERHQNGDLAAPSPRGWERVSAILDNEKEDDLSTNQRDAMIEGVVGSATASLFFAYLEEMAEFVHVDTLFKTPRSKRAAMLPTKEVGLYHLAYGIARYVTTAEMAKIGMQIIVDLDKVAERNPNAPIADIKVMMAELFFESCHDKGIPDEAILETPEYEQYDEQRRALLGSEGLI